MAEVSDLSSRLYFYAVAWTTSFQRHLKQQISVPLRSKTPAPLNHLCNYTHTQPFNGLWSRTTRVGRYQKKHSPTHTHPDHQTSFIIFFHLQRSMASSLFILRAWQVLSYNLSPGPLWSSSWSWTLNFILHTLLHPIIIIFSQHMPIPTQPVLLQNQCYVIYT